MSGSGGSSGADEPPALRADEDVLALLRRAATAATAATVDQAAADLAGAVRQATGWPVAYLLERTGASGRLVPAAWSSADAERFRVLRQVTMASSGADVHGVVEEALAWGRASTSADVGEAGAAAGLRRVLAFPLGTQPSDPVVPDPVVPGPSAALVFLAESAGVADPGTVESVSLAVAMLGAVVDRRRAAEAALALQAVAQGSGLPLVALDGDGVVMAWNGPAEAVFGWSAAEAVGRRFEQLVVPARSQAGAERDLDDLRASVADATPGSLSFTVADRTGREFPAELTLWASVAGSGPALAGLIRPLGPAPGEARRPVLLSAARSESAEEAALRRAIDEGELRLVYQPIVHLGAGRRGAAGGAGDWPLAGFEALVRWAHPGRGVLAPPEFIPLAESSGLIVPLGRYVLAEACRQAAAWAGYGPLRMSVNVSARQLATDGWVEEVATILELSGLVPRRLMLEITETVVMEELGAVVPRLEELRRLGVRIAIDDFGTGHSSLSYLRTLPVDVLKIDKSFIDGIALGPHESALARAIIKLAATLRLDAVAEGVSDARQLAQLRRLHCPYGQGYLFARPLAPEACVELLEVVGGRALDGLDDGLPVAARAAGDGHEVVDAEQ